MRVAVDCHMVGQPAAGDAGNARFVTTLTRALATTRTDADSVIALTAHPAAPDALRGAATPVPVTGANVARLLRDAPRALREQGADAAVFTYIAPPRSPCPIVLFVHDVTFRLRPEWFSRRDRALLGRLVPASLRRADAVATISEASRRDIVDAFGLDPARVHVVPCVPDPVFSPRPGAAGAVRERWGLDRYCLFVGDVHPRKNLAALADAIGLVGDRGLELAVVGKTGYEGAELIRASGGRWLGAVGDEDLATLYSAATVTCYPSLYEGFGLPVVEAMACGSPVVASNRGAIPEVAGDAAILVDPFPATLADGIRAALEPETAARLRAAGPPRAAVFTPARMGNAAWDVLRSVA